MDKANYWVKQIKRMLSEKRYKFAKVTLTGILDDVQIEGRITDNQIQAIKNIQWGKNDDETEVD